MKKEDVNTLMHSFKALVSIIIPSAATALIGDPVYAVGASNLFLQTLFHVQGDVKLKRVTMLLEKLEEGIKSIDSEFDLEKVDRIELADLVETAIYKASRANSESKIDRLKKIIIGQIKSPAPYDYVSRYLQLAPKLNDKQIIVLKKYVDTEKEFVKIQDHTHDLKEGLEKSKLKKLELDQHPNVSKKQKSVMVHKMKQLEVDLNSQYSKYRLIHQERNEHFKILGEDEFDFMMNDLRTLGLIFNPAEGRASNTGEYAGYRCTRLAMGFMTFLEE